MKKRILAVVLAAAMLALLATGCSANGTADNSKDGAVVIGGLAPLTGDVSIYGIATNTSPTMKRATRPRRSTPTTSWFPMTRLLR